MEIVLEKAREYILALKDKGDFTFEQIGEMSGVAHQTIRNFCTKKTEKNPGFMTIVKVVLALGGDLNELIGYDKKKEIEVNSTISLKESYESRIECLTNSYETRIEDVKALCEIRIADIIKCCETRIADILKCCENRIADQKQIYEERIAAYKEILKIVKIVQG